MPKRATAPDDDSATKLQAFTVRVPAELHRALRVVAADENKSVNDLLIEIAEDWWQRRPDRRRYEDFLRGRSREGRRP